MTSLAFSNPSSFCPPPPPPQPLLMIVQQELPVQGNRENISETNVSALSCLSETSYDPQRCQLSVESDTVDKWLSEFLDLGKSISASNFSFQNTLEDDGLGNFEAHQEVIGSDFSDHNAVHTENGMVPTNQASETAPSASVDTENYGLCHGFDAKPLDNRVEGINCPVQPCIDSTNYGKFLELLFTEDVRVLLEGLESSENYEKGSTSNVCDQSLYPDYPLEALFSDKRLSHATHDDANLGESSEMRQAGLLGCYVPGFDVNLNSSTSAPISIQSSTNQPIPISSIFMELNAHQYCQKNDQATFHVNSAMSQSTNAMQQQADPNAPHKEQLVLSLERTPSSQKSGVVDESEQSSSQRNRKRAQSSTDKSGECKRCKCKKTGCLKLYCHCFAAGEFCLNSCACENCRNKPEFLDEVNQTRKEIEARKQHTSKGKGNLAAPALSSVRKGCTCKNSMCSKNYCECFKYGVRCSDACHCEGCSNSFGRKPVDLMIPASSNLGKGCTCKNSKCCKKYCECYKSGVGCSDDCHCEGCSNSFGKKLGWGQERAHHQSPPKDDSSRDLQSETTSSDQ